MAFFGSEGPVERELARLQKENREKDALLVSEETRYAAKCKELHEANLVRDDALYRLQQEAERAAKAEASLDKRTEEVKQWQIKGHQMESAIEQANKTIKELQRDNRKAESDLDAVASFTSAEKTQLDKKISQLETTLRARDGELSELRRTGDRNRFGYASTNVRRETEDGDKLCELETQLAALRAENQRLSSQAQSTSDERPQSVLGASAGPGARPRTSMGFNAGSSIPVPSSRIPAPTPSSATGAKRRRSSSFSVNNQASGPAAVAVARLERDLAETRSTLVSTENELSATQSKLSKAERELLKAENQLMALERSHKTEVAALKSKLDDASDEVFAARAELDEGVKDVKQQVAARQRELEESLVTAQARVAVLEGQVKNLEAEKESIIQESSSSAARLTDLGDQVTRLEQDLCAARNELASAQSAQATAQAEAQSVSALAAQLEASQAAAAKADEQISELSARLAEAETALAAAAEADQSTSLRTTVAELEKQLQEARERASSAGDESGRLLLAAEADIAASKQEADALRAELERLGSERDALKAAEEGLVADKEAQVAAVADLSTALETAKTVLEATRQEIDDVKVAHANAAQEREAVEQSLAAAKEELASHKQALSQRTEEVAAASQVTEDLRGHLAAATEAHVTAAARVKELESALASVTAPPARSFDDEEVHALRDKHAATEAILKDVGAAFDESKERLHEAEDKIRTLETLEWGAVQGRDAALAKISVLESMVEKLEEDHAESIVTLNGKLSAAQDALSQAQKDHEAALEAMKDAQLAVELRLEGSEAAAAARTEEAAGTITSLEARIIDFEKATRELEGKRDARQKAYDQVVVELETAAAKITVSEQELERLRAAAAVDQRDTAQELSSLQAQLAAGKADIETLRSEKSRASEACDSLRRSLAEAEASVGSTTDRIAALTAQVEALEDQVAAKTQELEGAVAALQVAQQASAGLGEQERTLSDSLEQASLLIARLREEKVALSDACAFAVNERDAAAEAHELASSELRAEALAAQSGSLATTRNLQSVIVALLLTRLQARLDQSRTAAARKEAEHAFEQLNGRLRDTDARLAESVSHVATLADAKAAAEAKQADLSSSREDLDRQLGEAQSGLAQALGECALLRTEVDALRAAPTVGISAQTEAVVDLRREVASLEARVQRRNDLVSSKQLAIDQLEANLVIARDEVASLAEELQSAKASAALERASERETVEDLTRRLSEVEVQLGEARVAKTSLDNRIEQEADQVVLYKQQIESKAKELDALRDLYDTQRAQLTAALSEATLVSSHVAALQGTAERFALSNADLGDQVRELNVTASEQRATVSSLNASLSALQGGASAEAAQLRDQLEQAEAARQASVQALEASQVAQAEAAGVARSQLAEQEAVVEQLRAEVEAKNQEIRSLADQIATSSATLAASEETAAAASVRLVELEAEANGARDHVARVQSELEASENAQAGYLASIERLEASLRSHQDETNATRQQLSSEAATISELKAQLATAQDAMRSSQSQIEELNATQSAESATLTAELEGLKQRHQALEKEVAAKREELAQASTVIDAQSQELDMVKHELEALVEDFNGCTAELERVEVELKAKTEAEHKLSQELAMTETTAADARRATERLDDAHAEIRRLTTTLADKDAAVTRLKSDLSALAEASQAAQTATSAAQDRVKDLEAQLENKLMEVGDAEDQLLLQMKENKRALNQIQKLKDRVHSLQRSATDSSPATLTAPTSTAPQAVEPSEPPASASRKRKFDTVSAPRRETVPVPGPSSVVSPKAAARPSAPKSASRKAVMVRSDSDTRPRHIESQEELKPPGPDETYSARQRSVLRERNANAEVASVKPASVARSAAKKDSGAGAAGAADLVKKPALGAKGAGLAPGGKSTADLLASIQALRRKQQQSAAGAA